MTERDVAVFILGMIVGFLFFWWFAFKLEGWCIEANEEQADRQRRGEGIAGAAECECETDSDE